MVNGAGAFVLNGWFERMVVFYRMPEKRKRQEEGGSEEIEKEWVGDVGDEKKYIWGLGTEFNVSVRKTGNKYLHIDRYWNYVELLHRQ